MHTTLLALSLALCAPALAQTPCGTWDDAFGLRGADNVVSSAAVYDDGTGPKLVVGGYFDVIGETSARRIAAWDGASWSTFGAGFGLPGAGAPVHALVEFQGALVAAGNITSSGGQTRHHVVRWNGTTWEDLGGGTNGIVHALVVHQGALYAGGVFSQAGGVPASRIARFDGASWSALGSGIDGFVVSALETVPEPGGSKLYAAGTFTSAGGVPASGIARWDGANWSSLDGGLYPTAGIDVRALEVHDDGTGSALYVGGFFQSAGSAGLPVDSVARWNGTAWSAVGAHGATTTFSLLSYDSGGGVRRLAAGTAFGGSTSGHVQSWNGTSWSTLGFGPSSSVLALAQSQGELIAAGDFESADGVPALRLARWNGAQWLPFGDGVGPIAFPEGACVHDAGSGPELFVAGGGSAGGAIIPDRLGSWDGTRWAAAPGFDFLSIEAPYGGPIASYDAGGGARLYAAAYRTYWPVGPSPWTSVMVAWDGVSSVQVFPGNGLVSGWVQVLAVHDDGTGPGLYAAGLGLEVPGVSSYAIARYDAQGWTGLGTGVNGRVSALCTFDDGGGPDLYVAGAFDAAGGGPARSIARWDGTTWSTLGAGLEFNGQPADVLALAVHDDGSGPALYAGGYIDTAGGVQVAGLARWNGATWSGVGGGVAGGYGTVAALASFDDGGGRALFAGGYFTSAGGIATEHIARWRNGAWSAVDGGIQPRATQGPEPRVVRAMTTYDDGQGYGPDLYVDGWLHAAGGNGSHGIARLEGCSESGEPVCAGDGSAAPCPCANFGAAASGCANSVNSAGGRLGVSGAPRVQADTFTLVGSGMPNSSVLYFQGSSSLNNGAGIGFGDGLRCAGGAIVRLGTQANVGGSSTYPEPGDVSISVRGGVAPGDVRTYQAWYRNAASFCTSATFNLTNGWRVTWGT